MTELQVDEEEWVGCTLKNYERSRCISNVLSTTSERAVPKGNNFSSELFRLKLKVVLNSGEIVERSVIYKAMTNNLQIKPVMKKIGLFLKEAMMFKEILPAMEDIRRKKDMAGEQLWPECYGVKRGNEAYLLEDLVESGFKLANRHKGLDFTHSKLAIESLAKFHALAAIASETGEIGRSNSDKYFIATEGMTKMTLGPQFTQFADVMEQKWKGEWVEYAARLRAFRESYPKKVEGIFKIDESKFNTLVHSDYWLNNMMFKYDSKDRPVSLKIIDFQFSGWNNPGIDLNYFFLTSLNIETMDKRGELLRIYYDFLVGFLERFGYASPLPSYEDIHLRYETAAPVGYGMALAFRPVMMCPSDMSVDTKEITERLRENKGFASFDYEGEDFVKTMRFIVKEACDKGVM